MSEGAPQNQDPSLEDMVPRWREILDDANKLTREHVEPGNEAKMIAQLDFVSVKKLQRLLGSVGGNFETGSNGPDDQGGESAETIGADEKIMAAINDINHRREELNKQRDSRQ